MSSKNQMPNLFLRKSLIGTMTKVWSKMCILSVRRQLQRLPLAILIISIRMRQHVRFLLLSSRHLSNSEGPNAWCSMLCSNQHEILDSFISESVSKAQWTVQTTRGLRSQLVYNHTFLWDGVPPPLPIPRGPGPAPPVSSIPYSATVATLHPQQGSRLDYSETWGETHKHLGCLSPPQAGTTTGCSGGDSGGTSLLFTHKSDTQHVQHGGSNNIGDCLSAMCWDRGPKQWGNPQLSFLILV